MSRLCEGRVAVITGAGRGIGREYALMLANHGAKVVVNDLGADPDGRGGDAGPAGEVVEEIRAMGGEAVVNGADVSDFDAARDMIHQAIDTFGTLDILINNAGILRDRMVFSMSESDWDAVVQVHLKGTFAPVHHAAAWWREQTKAGQSFQARIINTASPSGIFGNVGQTNYGAAKAGIAAFTVISAMELVRYGITVNCIAPSALTRLTAPLMGGADISEEVQETMSPTWIAPIVTWLCSPEADNVTGRVWVVGNGRLGIAEGWALGPNVPLESQDPTTLHPVVADLMAKAELNADMSGNPVEGPGRPSHEI
ncbi:SDR family oxidoreductase [Candidatus Poriferisocius sp.]|uniref:SDR family oxidoreductase n=1 Tax=Candidatus Poriferisocius sp. TaxID=3101276 RepID=UPI003B022A60